MLILDFHIFHEYTFRVAADLIFSNSKFCIKNPKKQKSDYVVSIFKCRFLNKIKFSQNSTRFYLSLLISTFF